MDDCEWGLAYANFTLQWHSLSIMETANTWLLSNCHNVWRLYFRIQLLSFMAYVTKMMFELCTYHCSLFNKIYWVWWISNTWLLSKCFKTSVDLIKLYNYFISLQFKSCNHVSLMWKSLIFQRAWSVLKKSNNPFSQECVDTLCLGKNLWISLEV